MFTEEAKNKIRLGVKANWSQKHIKWISLWVKDLIPMNETYHRGTNEPSNHIQRWLREQRGEKCWTCGWAEVNPKTQLIPIQINHIDGDSTNNTPSNLELLCPNCHALTPTWGCHGKGGRNR